MTDGALWCTPAPKLFFFLFLFVVATNTSSTADMASEMSAVLLKAPGDASNMYTGDWRRNHR